MIPLSVKRIVWTVCIWMLFMICSAIPSWAGPLQERLTAFPDWTTKPQLQRADGDLYYPDWLAGEWQVTSTLVDLAAPLAPEIVSPGYASNTARLGQPVTFTVRFKPELEIASSPVPFPFPDLLNLVNRDRIVADREFNGTSLAAALLGPDALRALKIDPQTPNRQIARFQDGQQLVTTISDRAIEAEDADRFISSELYQQEFRGGGQIYFNQVENTIAYQLQGDNPPVIEADQVTAIYLSPQDPDYFKALDRPVALYRYRMEFERP